MCQIRNMKIISILAILICLYSVNVPALEGEPIGNVQLRETVAIMKNKLKTNICTDEIATELGVSQTECNKRKKNAIKHCTPFILDGMPEIVSLDVYSQTMQKIVFCESYMLSGCEYSNEFYEDLTKVLMMAQDKTINKNAIASNTEKVMRLYCPQSFTIK